MERARTRKAGLTVIEVMVGTGILLLSMLGFTRVVVFSDANPEARHEYFLASEAASRLVDELQRASFSDVFALYNDDPFDDPAGLETAPGSRIWVPGLAPSRERPIGPVGRIILPTLYNFNDGLLLREDVLDPALGMPRDLNGDSRVDQRDHSKDYILLPVTIRIEWYGEAGPSVLETRTLLADY